jgi:multidrug transporter EmrE-like cation transporter
MALNSISYVLVVGRLPRGLAPGGYVVVAILARLFLGERLGWVKIAAITLTLAGTALLAWERS